MKKSRPFLGRGRRLEAAFSENRLPKTKKCDTFRHFFRAAVQDKNPPNLGIYWVHQQIVQVVRR